MGRGGLGIPQSFLGEGVPQMLEQHALPGADSAFDQQEGGRKGVWSEQPPQDVIGPTVEGQGAKLLVRPVPSRPRVTRVGFDWPRSRFLRVRRGGMVAWPNLTEERGHEDVGQADGRPFRIESCRQRPQGRQALVGPDQLAQIVLTENCEGAASP